MAFRCFLLCCLCAAPLLPAADWPTYRADSQRSGIAGESLQLPLRALWTHHCPYKPAPAWPEMPAHQDFWHNLAELSPTYTYDRTYHVVVAGDLLYYASSADDAVHCLSAHTGKKVWTFYTEGPVRLAPTLYKGRVYVGSDDGQVYCLHGKTGQVAWTYRPTALDRRIPGNSRIVSTWPIRSGIVIHDNIAYFTAGIFPNQGVYLCAVNADNGQEVWQHGTDVSSQGYLLGSPKYLYTPSGRSAPVAYERKTGKKLGSVGSGGGCFAVVLNDILVHGGGEKGQIQITESSSREGIVSMPGLRLIARGSLLYILQKDSISVLDRGEYLRLSHQINEILKVKEKQRTDAQKQTLIALNKKRQACTLWKTPCPEAYTMIMAGDTLFAGQNRKVTAYSTKQGKRLWSASVDGKAQGLAAAQGRLFVSTDQGTIECYGTGQNQASPPIITRSDVSPRATDQHSARSERMARDILKHSGVTKGYCLLLNIDSAQLAYELARQSELHVLAIDPDARKVDQARSRISRTGLYGQRIAIHQGDLEATPYQDYCANLIVYQMPESVDQVPTRAAELKRLLRPGKGKLILFQAGDKPLAQKLGAWDASDFLWLSFWRGESLSWALAQRPKLDGIGQWTHLYADPANTACSGDTHTTDTLQLAWFGRPGPRKITDRHHRSMSPLFQNGQLFIYGDERIISADAYNGTVLWDLPVPGSRRLGMMNDCGNMCVSGDTVYIAAADKCWLIDVDSGICTMQFRTPAQESATQAHWGYMATAADQLFGSVQKPTSSFASFGFGNETVGQIEGDFKLKALSHGLFSLHRRSGHLLWRYQRGLIINSAIAIGPDHIYFIESRNAELLANPQGRISAHQFCAKDTFLVALDRKTGGLAWDKPFRFPYEHQVFLSCAAGKVIVTGSRNTRKQVVYDLYAFASATGRRLWHTITPTPAPSGGVHGEQWQHPAIIGQQIYLTPRDTSTLYTYDLHTGAQSESQRPKWGGCGTISASTSHIFYRNANPEMQNLQANEQIKITNSTRVGCWINILPAGGMVLIPEGSSGCTCAYSLQTSMGFIPVSQMAEH